MGNDSDNPAQLEWSGERFLPRMGGNIRLEHLHRYFLARGLAANKRVLDIACGEGYGSDLLAEVAAHVVGVDIATEAIEHARGRYTRDNLEFRVGECTAMPLEDRSVDLVVCFETIEHLEAHDAMMAEVRRVLVPGGSIVISSPDRREYSDIPAYKNPFHVRELYREEFEALLRSHFQNVIMVGQRVWAGSFAWMLERPMESTVGMVADESGAPKEGPLVPVYLIAIASDQAVMPVPMSVLDGGGFVWPEDYVHALQSLEEERRNRVAEIDEVNQLRSVEVESLKGDLDAHQTRLLELTEQRSQAEAQLGAMRTKLDEYAKRTRDAVEAHAATESQVSRLRDELAELRQNNAQLKQTVRDLASPLEDTQRQLRLAEMRLADFDSARRSWIGIQLHLKTTITALEHSRRPLEEQIISLEGAQRRLMNHVEGMETSLSWRITAPLRAARSMVRRTGSLARSDASTVARKLYSALPISSESRLRVKSAVFRTAPFLFRRTSTYQAWQEYKRTQTRLVSRPPTLETPAPALAEMPTVWFQTDRAEDHVPIANTRCAGSRIKAIAFYLPQFHPIPENDEWWGKGFTEWDNVTRGRPQFVGHYQPHLPGELGYYDLRVAEVQRRQIELARLYGLYGFCYHLYWFGGRRLLRRPLDHMMTNPGLDFPFCLCWANENWTRRWDGHEHEILIAQRHSPEDDLAFIKDIEPILRDSRYIRVGGRPLVIIYRPTLLPNARETAERWREHCLKAGIGDPFLVSTQAFDHRSPEEFGFDAAMEFAPNNLGSPPANARVPSLLKNFQGTVYEYEYLVERSRSYSHPADYTLFRCVAPMWDNEARRPDHGRVFMGSTPALYAEWLENACRDTETHLGTDRRFVFINAWNEWAEGAHLEPDRRYGYAYLQATADALSRFPVRTAPGREPIKVPSRI